jgi:hypothetical protein
MKLGIVLPSELEDPVALRDFVHGIEELGCDHINFPDHPVSANPASHTLTGPTRMKPTSTKY